MTTDTSPADLRQYAPAALVLTFVLGCGGGGESKLPELDSAEAYSNRGINWCRKGNYDYGIADYTQAIQLNPDFVDAYINRGLAYANKDQPDKAIADYTQAIQLNPNFAWAYINRGVVYAGKGQSRKSKADFEKARQLKSTGISVK